MFPMNIKNQWLHHKQQSNTHMKVKKSILKDIREEGMKEEEGEGEGPDLVAGALEDIGAGEATTLGADMELYYYFFAQSHNENRRRVNM